VPPEVSTGAVMRNASFNLVGQVVPAVVALITIPYVVSHLGIARFGILSLSWAILSYLTLFDFGLGRATIKFVAGALAVEERHTIGSIVWTSAAAQLAFGMVGGSILYIAAPDLSVHVFRVPASLIPEATAAFQLLGVIVPILITSSCFKGVLEAHQRFGLVNIVRTVSGSLIFLAPAVGVAEHQDLRGILSLLLGSIVATAIAYMSLCLWVAPALRTRPTFDRIRLKKLIVFGGWITVSSLVVPVLVYADRFLLGAIVSVSALAFYTVPYELVFRLQVFPASLGTALFPTFSALAATRSTELGALFARSFKYLLVAMAPATLVLVLAARPILKTWLGEEFALNSTLVLQVLAFGMLLNALSQIPAQLLDGSGRPELRAIVFLAYTPVYIVAAWLLISRYGAVGAAMAWTARAALELVLFFGVASVVLHLKLDVLVRNRFIRAAGVSIGFSALSILVLLTAGATTELLLLLSVGTLALFAIVVWLYAFDNSERNRAKSLLTSFAGQLRLSQ
jgi:O-antigen/teichoic acid export membrane protein